MPRTFVVFGLAAVLVASACGATKEQFETIFDPCETLVLEPESGMTEGELSSIEEAIALWNHVASVQLTMEPLADAPRLSIALKDSWYFGRYDDIEGRIELSTELTDPHMRAIVLAHELGHALGLYHVESSPSVMNKGNLDTAPNDRDAQALISEWGECAQNAQN